jgi:hypothetical protein
MDKFHGGQELARFEKNSCEDVRLNLHNFGCGRYVDIRCWSKIRPSDNAPSNPTQNGFMLDESLLPDLRRAVDQAIVALRGKAEDKELVIRIVHTRDEAGGTP